MKWERIYFVSLSIVYALVFLLGNWSDTSPEGVWNSEAAPWLGEAPAGVTCDFERADSGDALPLVIFNIPPNEQMRRTLLELFAMQKVEGESGRYANFQVKPLYPAENTPALTAARSCISPWLEVMADGSMRFCVDDANVPFDEQKALPLAPPYPQYLPQGQWELLYRELMLAVLCFAFPAVFCCVGWLWVQRRSLCGVETKRICLLVTAIVAFIGAYGDFSWHGFASSYSVFSAVVAVILNLLVAGILMGVTALVRCMLGRPF